MKNFTQQQREIADQFIATYDGITEDQISFQDNQTEPILDYEALLVYINTVAELTFDLSDVVFFVNTEESRCIGSVKLDEKREIKLSEFAKIGELLPDNSSIQLPDDARRVARSRTLRSLIRAAGINILKTHKHFISTGEAILTAKPIDPRANSYKEIGILKRELGLEVGTDDSEYRRFLIEAFDGKKSPTEFDDIELRRLIMTLRSMKRTQEVTQKLAA